MLALLKSQILMKVKEISTSEWDWMLRAVTRNRTKQNHRHLKAIVIKYNMIINGLLCAECISLLVRVDIGSLFVEPKKY